LALAIRLESPGSPLFVQKRWGKDQKEVSIYKFRSMWADKGDHSGVQQTVAGDSRITKIGAFIRKTNIDELPQLLNVLLGDMSLIGPRCHPIGMKSAGMLYEDLCPDYHERHQMRPGITGLAQVRGLRGPTVRSRDGRARLASDLYYVRHYSFMLDLKIFFGTFYREIMRGGRGF
jgi:lipopolysaccharide/colanic/teichoic acid biosynthesis glycosyltransferase